MTREVNNTGILRKWLKIISRYNIPSNHFNQAIKRHMQFGNLGKDIETSVFFGFP